MDCKEVRSEWVWHLGSGRGPRPQPEGRRRQGKERLFLKTCLLSSFRLGIGRGDCSRLRGGAGAVAVASEREPMGRMRGGRFNEKQAKDKRHRSPPPLPVPCRLQHSRLRHGVRSAHSRKRSAVAAAVASERQPMGRMRGGRFNEKQAKDKRHRSPPPLPVQCRLQHSRLRHGVRSAHSRKRSAVAAAVASERQPMGRMRGGRFNEKQAKDKRHRSPPPLPVQCRLQHSRLRQGVRSAHSRKRSAVAAAVASERQPMGRMRGGRFNEKQAKDKRHRSLPVGCKKEGSTGMFEYRLSSNARAREMAMSVRGGQQSRVGMQTNGQLQVCSRLWKMRLLVWVCALVAIGVLCDWQW